MAVALHPWSSSKKILLFFLHVWDEFEHEKKQSLGLFFIWDAQCIIGKWGSALKKSFEMMGAFIEFWRRDDSSSSSLPS
jgi:hypothetical protein